MKAMVFEAHQHRLSYLDIPTPVPTSEQILVDVLACGVCRTDLHIIDGELSNPKLPLILGHQIVGSVRQNSGVFKKGDRVGIPWLGRCCETCMFCKSKRENLCDTADFTGYTLNGGYAEVAVANQDFVFPLPKAADPIHLAPLLCAGMIGYRALKKTGNAKRIGFFGFGAAARILIQVALYQNREVFAFTRPGDTRTQDEAKQLGATWAGSSLDPSPQKLDAAIIFAPSGDLIPLALKGLQKGGKVVCGGIHMSDIPSFPYHLLFEERTLETIAHLTRTDGEEFLELAQKIPIETQTVSYPLSEANQALEDLQKGLVAGSAVLIP